MSAVFVDTSYLLALVRRSDQHHERAQKWRRACRGPFVTSEFVLIEFADCCSAPALRGACVAAIERLRASAQVNIVAASSALMNDGLTLFAKRRDKSWGLTDCTSISLMTSEGIREALSADRDFEEAGLVALLRADPPEVST